ncbi:Conserved DNA-binding protein YbaB [Nonomuraea solani]|uniref:Conserved DNA-binding protein YbaB n=1 Tax=Nonomuraea solani TaxID=1144553 RepID=A0A1H6EXQ2_9ACTN|nr:YbaB/EbfC family nucleoid-associated protein [Nonomuraea solani]SEH02660.1 Conserved DNA-binding protein YbaB [Nonomuraea solani]
MTDALRATIEELAGEYNQQVQRVKEAYGALGRLRAVARSKDGMVEVTVGQNGQLRSLKLDPRAYRKLSPSELAQAIMEQVAAATGDVAEQTRRLMQPLMPADLPFEQTFGENATLEAFLPRPVEPSM